MQNPGDVSMNAKLVCRVTLAVALLVVMACPVSIAAWHAKLLVDDDKVECPTAEFKHIQEAVNAASPGDEIHVCKGIYVEQVKIGKALDIDADNGAILMPTAMEAN